MLLPRYSLGHLLAGVVIGSLVFVVAAQAAKGAAWAAGVTVAVAAALVSLAVYALTFLAMWMVAVPYQARRMRRRGASPFEDLPEPLFAGEPGQAHRATGVANTAAAAGMRDGPGGPPDDRGSLVGGKGAAESSAPDALT